MQRGSPYSDFPHQNTAFFETVSTVASIECITKIYLFLGDWLLKYYDTRKSARDGEIDAMGKAKAVLSGADYSLVQTAAVHLRGSV